MISVVIADDQELVRTGLRMIIGAEDDLTVVGEAADGIQAVTRARELHPDVVLMDIRMPRLDGIGATQQILANRSTPRVLVLTTFSQSQLVYRALVAGASGFILKDMPGSQLVGAIRAVARGEELLAPSITRRLIEEFARPGTSIPEGYSRLTDRERQVLGLVARGLSNAEIGAELGVSVQTVKTHVARLLDKLDLRDRVQAVILAYDTGLIRPRPAAW